MLITLIVERNAMSTFKITKERKDCVYGTPQSLFDELDAEFHFDMDVAANDENHKCRIYYTEKENGLKQDWTGTVWCNPPYGRNIKAWVKKASERVGGVTVMLLPVRTDTGWWQDYILGKAEVRYIRGRLRFEGCKQNATFASAIVIFKGDTDGKQR